jgi:adenosylmethionine-8-amino-7-oxononanoate aminotransferase
MSTETEILSDFEAMSRESSVIAQKAVHKLWHHNWQPALFADTGPLMLVDGDGVLVRDISGREYLDFTARLAVTAIGHGRKEMAEAIAAQIGRLQYCETAGGISNVPAALLAHKLSEITPGELELTFFTSSGAEAVEAAFKMARQCQLQRGFPGRVKIISRNLSYHGTSFGALSATGAPPIRAPFEPLVPGFIHIAHPYCYRCELGRTYPECGVQCAEMLEQVILAEGPATVAAVIGEPVSAGSAVSVPPPEYWPKMREICDRYGILLIADEILIGMGRSGKMFASEYWGLEPDIMTIGKGLASGYVPLSAAIASRSVAEAFWGEPQHQFLHFGTFSGHPTACAAALTCIDIIEREHLVDNAAGTGARLREGLMDLVERPIVGNLNGIGLFQCLELLSDPDTKAPASPEVTAFLGAQARAQGVILRCEGHLIYFSPPLIIDSDHVDRVLDVVHEAIGKAEDRFGPK